MSAHHAALMKSEPGARRRWRELRAVALARAKYRCERCAAVNRLEVHHVRPVSAGGEPWAPENLEVVCRNCHFDVHRSAGRAVRGPEFEAWERFCGPGGSAAEADAQQLARAAGKSGS